MNIVILLKLAYLSICLVIWLLSFYNRRSFLRPPSVLVTRFLLFLGASSWGLVGGCEPCCTPTMTPIPSISPWGHLKHYQNKNTTTAWNLSYQISHYFSSQSLRISILFPQWINWEWGEDLRFTEHPWSPGHCTSQVLSFNHNSYPVSEVSLSQC